MSIRENNNYWGSISRSLLFIAASCILLCCHATHTMAGGGWNQHAGLFDFTKEYETSTENDYRNAAALVTFGYPQQGISRLKRMVKKHPDNPWAVYANFYLGTAYYQIGKYEEAFQYFGKYAAAITDREDINLAQNMQMESAARIAAKNVVEAAPLFENLIAEVQDRAIAANARYMLAEFYFEQHRYYSAMEAYLDFVDFHPYHAYASKAWFMIAKCQYQVAFVVDRGREYLMETEASLQDFLSHFPEDDKVGTAEEMLRKMQNLQAERTEEIADFYFSVRQNPYAALENLYAIKGKFPGTEKAQRAEQRIEIIKGNREMPAPGKYSPLPIKGVERKGDLIP